MDKDHYSHWRQGYQKNNLSMVANCKNVHDACMPTICCYNDTMYGSPWGTCIKAYHKPHTLSPTRLNE